MEIKHFISHRGNLNGEEPEYENTTDYINNALSKGFECEIDVWFVKNEFYLGHDTPEEKIDIEFILNNEKNLWIHCKNLECLEKFNDIKTPNYFWHENDKYTLTSKNYIWTYPNEETDRNSIIVSLGADLPKGSYIGICSDYIVKVKKEYLANL
tara:strand:- start:1168 stop:1629 length:462 start_codon:yes stop_codon:yes gene_type:complete